ETGGGVLLDHEGPPVLPRLRPLRLRRDGEVPLAVVLAESHGRLLPRCYRAVSRARRRPRPTRLPCAGGGAPPRRSNGTPACPPPRAPGGRGAGNASGGCAGPPPSGPRR